MLAANAASLSFNTIDAPGAVGTLVSGVNDSGEMVGFFVDSAGRSRGFRRTGSAFSIIDFPGATSTSPTGISASGQIVGVYTDSSGTDHGFLLTGPNFATIDVPGAGVTFPFAINSAGQIAGGYDNTATTVLESTNAHGFLRAGSSVMTIDFPGAGVTVAEGINDAGDIAGFYDDVSGFGETPPPPGIRHGFLLSGSTFQAIDFPGATLTLAMGINSGGQIVGQYDLDDTSNLNMHGFLLSGSTFSTIDFPGATFTQARGINASGWIVGDYVDTSGNVHGFLATPVPEPGTLLLLLSALCLLILHDPGQSRPSLQRRGGGGRKQDTQGDRMHSESRKKLGYFHTCEGASRIRHSLCFPASVSNCSIRAWAMAAPSQKSRHAHKYFGMEWSLTPSALGRRGPRLRRRSIGGEHLESMGRLTATLVAHIIHTP